MNIAVIGLGLIGGSLARAIKEKSPQDKVLGHDRDGRVLEAALTEGAIDAPLTDRELSVCDMVLVALYPGDTVDFVKRNCARFSKGAVVIDCCGVKRTVCDELFSISKERGFLFVGGHPMAGSEHSGFAFSRVSLFKGASMILTPPPHVHDGEMERIVAFFSSLGFSRITVCSVDHHDRMIAYTSQLAHVLSSAYIKSPAAKEHTGFSAGSFNDMTRVAYLNEDMWAELFIKNADYLKSEIEGLCERLYRYRDAIEKGDESGLKALLKEGREQKTRILKAGGAT